MKSKILFAVLCSLILYGIVYATDYPIHATFTFSTADAPVCDDLDSLVIILAHDGADSSRSMKAFDDTVAPCWYTYDTTVTTPGDWSVAAYAWIGGAIVNFTADPVHVPDTLDYQSKGDTNSSPFDAGADGVIVTTNNDKSGYSLSANQSGVTIGTVTTLTNKTGFSLIADQSAVTIGVVNRVDSLSDTVMAVLLNDSLSLLMGDVDAIKTQTDEFVFVSGDVKATLDGETVALTSTNVNIITVNGTTTTTFFDSAFAADVDTNTNPFDNATDQVIVATNNDKTGYSISGSITTLDGLNDPTVGEIYSEFTSEANEEAFWSVGDTNSDPFNAGGDGVTLSSTNVNVITVNGTGTTTFFDSAFAADVDTNSDPFNAAGDGVTLTSTNVNVITVNGTTTTEFFDSAFTADVDTNSDPFNAAADQVIVATNNDKSGYTISGTITTFDGLNNFDYTSEYVFVSGFGDTASHDFLNDDTAAYDPAFDAGTYGRELLDGGAGGGASEGDIYTYFTAGSREEEFWGDCEPGDGGSKTLVLWIADSAAHAGDTTDVPLGQCNLTMYNLGQTVKHSGGGVQTDDNGFRSFTSTAETGYEFLKRLTGYTFNPTDTLTTTAGSDPDTFCVYGYPFSLGTPSVDGQIRLSAFIYDMAGDPVQGAVASLRLVAPRRARDTLVQLKESGVLLNMETQTSTSDVDGLIYFDAWPTDTLIPGGMYYEYMARDSLGNIIPRHDKSIRPTGTSNLDIADL